MKEFKAGFANIIGYPNVGKSTLINALLKEKISIVTPKAQTTRNRIMGFLNTDEYQLIFSDTPGILEPKYELQRAMLSYVQEALEDADIIIYMTEAKDSPDKHADYLEKIRQLNLPVFLVINKIDEVDQLKAQAVYDFWRKSFSEEEIYIISALHDFNVDQLLKGLLEKLPVHPPYYDEDMLTDKSERFIASEIVREKILLVYQQEVPYSTEVVVTSFKESDDIIRILADILVERDSQKPIIIGKGGASIKKTGILAREDMEKFFNKKVYLELFVKVKENWRNDKNFLKHFGYLK